MKMDRRVRVGAWVESAPVQRTIVTLILINAITLGLETSAPVMAAYGPPLIFLDHLILTVFVIEIALKLYAARGKFFRDSWNIFDFLVVGIALVPSAGPLAVLRALRVLRVLRLISVVPRLRFVVEALLRAMPGISSIAGLLLLLMYVFAVMATGLFGARFPEWFGSVEASMYTLFQVMTLESWSMGIVRPVMAEYPLAWMFFIPFILIATFSMLNLFIGIIVDTMQTLHDSERERESPRTETRIPDGGVRLEAEMQALREELRALRATLSPPPGGRLDPPA